MKVAILAGGVGARLEDDPTPKPKPMIEIGGRPILWHIMMLYAHYGYNDFIIALGYKGELIKKYIVDYASLSSNLSVSLKTGEYQILGGERPNWQVDLIDTGIPTATGGRISRLRPYLSDGTFVLTLGDAVSDIDVNRLLDFHHRHGKLATMVAVRPTARFGHLKFDGDRIISFAEKPQTAEGWLNGAIFVLEPGIFEYIEGDDTQWEREPLQRLAADGHLMAYAHEGFWLAVDTLRDKRTLDSLWESTKAPWKLWKD